MEILYWIILSTDLPAKFKSNIFITIFNQTGIFFKNIKKKVKLLQINLDFFFIDYIFQAL